MGTIIHDAVIVTAADYYPQPDIAAFRESLPDEWQRLVIGPVQSITNGYLTYAFLPDGSKEGWDTSDAGNEYRDQFAALFSFRYDDGSSPFDVVRVSYGETAPPASST